MIAQNKGSKAGLVLGGLGGIISIAGLAYYYDGDFDSISTLGALLLMAAMYFALAGAFSVNGQWTPKALTFFAFLTAAVVIAVTAIELIGILFGAVEVVIAALIILISYTPATQRFVSKN